MVCGLCGSTDPFHLSCNASVEESPDEHPDEQTPEDVVVALFEKVEDDFLKFDRIDQPLHPSSTVCAMMKVASLMKDPKKFDVQAEHDRLFLPTLRELVTTPTEEDILYLTRCGVFWDSDISCFGMHC